MRKKLFPLVFSLIAMALLLAGCKLPASQPPEEVDEVLMTTPIVIITDAPAGIPEDPDAVPPEGDEEATQAVEDFFAEPTATPEPTIMVPTVTRPAQYTLQEGEFPFCIARRFDVDPGALLSLNNFGPNQLIEPGTTIQIPQTGTWTGESRVRNPHPTTHTVRAGESIYSIACFYGDVSPEAIIAVNQLEEPYTLSVGQTLDIP